MASDADKMSGFTMELVAEDCWRACDKRIALGDASRMVAYVQLRGTQYEVTQIGRTFRWSMFSTLKDALASIRLAAPTDLSDRSQGEFSFIR